jgi:hypothetical protein
VKDTRDQMARTIESYYAALAQTRPESSPYRRFVDHDVTLREFGSRLEYGGWDSHQDQSAFIEPKLNDVFGLNRGWHTLWDNLPSDVKSNVIIVVSGEFGRQLVANGGNGTDHGRGNAMLVIGEPVRGDIYGDIFPEQELARLGDRGADINGLTQLDRLFGRVCDAVSPGSAPRVFPNINNTMLEPNLGLGQLFS